MLYNICKNRSALKMIVTPPINEYSYLEDIHAEACTNSDLASFTNTLTGNKVYIDFKTFINREDSSEIMKDLKYNFKIVSGKKKD
jgi:hypothetical protein